MKMTSMIDEDILKNLPWFLTLFWRVWVLDLHFQVEMLQYWPNANVSTKEALLWKDRMS